MKKLKHINEWVDYNRDEYDWDDDGTKSPDYDLMNVFREFHDSVDLKPYEPINFLKSLNLTDEQYKKLAKLIEIYGFEKWKDGNTEGYNQGAYPDDIHFTLPKGY